MSPFIEMVSEFLFLSLVTFLFLFGVILIVCIPRENVAVARVIGIFVGTVTFLVSLLIWCGFDDVVGFQFVDRAEWVGGGINYIMGVDGISFLLVLFITFLTPLMLLLAIKVITDRIKEFVMCVLMLEMGMLGAFLALDLVFFYLFWEVMLIFMYLLIGIWGGKQRIYAIMKFFLYIMVGFVLMLVGIIYLYLDVGGISSSFVYVLANVDLSCSEELWFFGVFGLVFAIKVFLFPFHTWLPDAHTEVSIAGSVILAGVLLKLGTYGFLRFAFPLFPEVVGVYSALMMVLVVVGILYGVFVVYN